MKKAYLFVLLFIFNLTSGRGQKPGQMNEYDAETNTVFDEAPPDDSWHNWFADLIFTEEGKQKRYGRNHGSVNEKDKHGSLWTELWEDLKLGAQITLVILILLILAAVSWIGYRVHKRRKEAQNRRWYQWNR